MLPHKAQEDIEEFGRDRSCSSTEELATVFEICDNFVSDRAHTMPYPTRCLKGRPHTFGMESVKPR